MTATEPNSTGASADRPEPEEALSETPNADRDADRTDRDVRPVERTDPRQPEPPIDDDDRDPANRSASVPEGDA